MDIRRFYLDKNDISGSIARIGGAEFFHLTKVLRHKVGYKIIVCNDFDNIDYYATIKAIEQDVAIAEIYDKVPNNALTRHKVTLFQALPKGDKLDLIVQKAVELGVSKIQPFYSKNVAENKFNLERIQRIALEASKQCGRAKVAIIADIIDFSDILVDFSQYSRVILASEHEKQCTLSQLDIAKVNGDVALIVGSEGGFEQDEVNRIVSHGGIAISLGNRILRTETASIAMLAIILYQLGEME